jgi:hypothetical protein
MVNFRHILHIERLNHVMPPEFEAPASQQVRNIDQPAGIQIIYADDLATFFDKPLTQGRT